MSAPDPRSWDEDALADDDVTDSPGFGGGQGRMPSEIADTGSALVGCCGWTALVFAAWVLWLIYASVTG